MAAALGRLLAEGRPGQPLGAAHGEQSRWIQTQRANAFAAEFLLPTPALSRPGDLEAKCDQYGISRTAARWHMRNRLVTSELCE
jgi:Zn-dependent peptidase ImmA (M78 family)